MEPSHPKKDWFAKPAAASVGATVTALTMTPFDVIKTRLQTQPPLSLKSASLRGSTVPLLFPKVSRDACCQPSSENCIRSMHSFTVSHTAPVTTWVHPVPQAQVVCLWDGKAFRNRAVHGFRDAAWQVWRAEGFGGLWKGLGTTLCIAVPSQTSYMVLYDNLLNHVLPQHAAAPLIAGVMARTTITTAFSPLELLRTRLQATPSRMDGPRTLRGTIASIRHMVRADGLPSLWRGLSTTLWRDVPFSGIYWMCYESSKTLLSRRGHEGTLITFTGGAASGMLAAIITSPFDVLKTRRQAIGSTNSSTFFAMSQLVRQEGYKSLFIGLTPRLAKIAPACGIMIACYEGLSDLLTR